MTVALTKPVAAIRIQKERLETIINHLQQAQNGNDVPFVDDGKYCVFCGAPKCKDEVESSALSYKELQLIQISLNFGIDLNCVLKR